jgi:uncharacterized protein (TIRG00374 family)
MDASMRKPSRWLHLALSVVIITGLGIAAWKYLSAEEMLEALREFRYAYAAPILALSVLYLYFKSLRFIALLRPMASLSAGLLIRVYFAGQPATVIPGGVAARAALLAEPGVPPGSSCGPIIYSSLMDQLMFIVATLLAALWYPPARGIALWSLAAVIVISALLAFRPFRDLATRMITRLAARLNVQQQWEYYCQSLTLMHNLRTLSLALLWSALSFIVPVFMFQLCLLGIGEHVPFFTLLLAYTIPTMAGRLTVLPGGIGVTEAGMIGMLEELSGLDPNSGAVAAALFRLGDALFQGFVGGLVYIFFWRGANERELGMEQQIAGANLSADPVAH